MLHERTGDNALIERTAEQVQRPTAGSSSLDVVKYLVGRHSAITHVNLFGHVVGKNWRQEYQGRRRLENIASSFLHEPHDVERTLLKSDFLNLSFRDLANPKDHSVWSFCSRVYIGGEEYHLPMMNFHPEGVTKSESIPYILSAIGAICGSSQGFLLDSGRYFHYYGDFLLSPVSWVEFNASFLMPSTLVSPRYVGHCLHNGYSTLRLTADMLYKPTVPTVIGSIGPVNEEVR